MWAISGRPGFLGDLQRRCRAGDTLVARGMAADAHLDADDDVAVPARRPRAARRRGSIRRMSSLSPTITVLEKP